MSHKITLSNMMFYGYHGVYDFERDKGQRFFVDLEIKSDLKSAASSDMLSDTFDYTVAYSKIKNIMENRKFKLLEALAEAIAYEVMLEELINEVTIRIRKVPPMPGCFDYVELETTRKK